MTKKEWAEILAGLSDPAEVKIFLLAVSDAMDDVPAQALRELASRPEGVRPCDGRGQGYLNDFVWCADHHLAPDGWECSKLPKALKDLLPDSRDSGGRILFDGEVECRYYDDAQGAWAALFAALPAYARGKVTA